MITDYPLVTNTAFTDPTQTNTAAAPTCLSHHSFLLLQSPCLPCSRGALIKCGTQSVLQLVRPGSGELWANHSDKEGQNRKECFLKRAQDKWYCCGEWQKQRSLSLFSSWDISLFIVTFNTNVSLTRLWTLCRKGFFITTDSCILEKFLEKSLYTEDFHKRYPTR